MIPESLSFAILAGFHLSWIVRCIYNGLSNGLLVDLEWYLVSRATVIVLIALMKSNGLEYVFAALAGVIQILIGLFKLGKFIRLVPQPVMFGFVNGLAIIILCLSWSSSKQS
jgi:SulP family sulfate permease